VEQRPKSHNIARAPRSASLGITERGREGRWRNTGPLPYRRCCAGPKIRGAKPKNYTTYIARPHPYAVPLLSVDVRAEREVPGCSPHRGEWHTHARLTRGTYADPVMCQPRTPVQRVAHPETAWRAAPTRHALRRRECPPTKAEEGTPRGEQ
jgi:hypothetical protein